MNWIDIYRTIHYKCKCETDDCVTDDASELLVNFVYANKIQLTLRPYPAEVQYKTTWITTARVAHHLRTEDQWSEKSIKEWCNR